MAPSTGFFFEVKQGDITVLQWDTETEDFLDETQLPQEQILQQKEGMLALLTVLMELLRILFLLCYDDDNAAVRSLAHDKYLGPYAEENARRWLRLSYFVTPDVLRRLEPVSGKIRTSNQSSIQEQEEETESFADRCKNTDPERLKLQLNRETKGFLKEARFATTGNGSTGNAIFYSTIRGVGRNSTASEKTAYGVDTSYALVSMLEEECKKDNRQYYGELQLAFITFLLGESLESFEQWKRLVDMVCRAEKLLIGVYEDSTSYVPRTEFWEHVYGIINTHMQEIPDDFFIDELSKDNFLGKTLSCLKATLSAYKKDMDNRIYNAAKNLLQSVTNKFHVDLLPEEKNYSDAQRGIHLLQGGSQPSKEQLKAMLGPEWDGEDDEDLPPIVDMNESTF